MLRGFHFLRFASVSLLVVMACTSGASVIEETPTPDAERHDLPAFDGAGDVEMTRDAAGSRDLDITDAGVALDAPVDAPDDVFTPAPWPPEELTLGPSDPQPTGDGWRTASWNVCTTSMDGGRLECRARIAAEDAGRTAAELERAAIASYFSGDENMYSFTLQEVCEEDARWIAAFVANGGPPAAGWDRDFDEAEYSQSDEKAPYAFLPYFTRELLGERDLGCGAGISTGIAAIAKREPGTTGFDVRGLTNATYDSRRETGFTAAHLVTPDVCELYFEHQTSYEHTDPEDTTSPYRAVDDFRTTGCTSAVPATLRGVACVRTRWRGPGDSTTYRVSTCATHAVHKGKVAAVVRNHQIDEAALQLFDFAGGEGQRSILSGDFNVVARRGAGLGLDDGEIGHHTLLTSSRHGLSKVTIGNHAGTDGTGTHRGNCGREIDAIYVRNAWWLQSPSPNVSACRDLGEDEPAARGPAANPFEWSDHEMMVSPLMSPSGNGPPDF